MAPLGGLAAALRTLGTGRSVLVGGETMTAALDRTIRDALDGSESLQDATDLAWALMHRKSGPELDAIRAACALLDTAALAMRGAHRSGAAVTDVVLAGERAAGKAGAQDVRTLFSLDGGGTLQPFTTPKRAIGDPLQVYVAVRRFNYWAEAFVPLASRPHPAGQAAAAILRCAAAAVKPGARADDLSRMIATASAPYRMHPMTACVANTIGLALEQPPHTDIGDTFAAGEVYSLKVGLTDGAEANAIVSAMVAVGDDASDILWEPTAAMA
jgi:hypothetical protein